MSSSAGTALARVTIAAPRRRVDVALPEQAPVAELLPALLRTAGEELADLGQQHDGWVLRRPDGRLLEAARSLGAQGVRDGEVLHLVPRQTEWPELDYDDVVDAIAAGAQRESRPWGPAATRRAGLAAGVVGLLAALALVVSAGAPWGVPGGIAAGLAALLLLGAAAVSRAGADSGAGAALGAVAAPAAFLGALLVLHGDRPLAELSAAQYLAASAVLVLAGLLVVVGVGDRVHVGVAAMTVGVLGVAGSLAAAVWDLPAVGVAAVLAALGIALTPAVPLLAIRLGGLPLPALPTSTEDLLADQPVLPRARVQARVRRTDEVLTGLLAGTAFVGTGAVLVLALAGDRTADVLAALVVVASLLRARVFPALRHRLPLLAVGAVGALGLAAGSLAASSGVRLAVVAVLLLAAGLVYADRAPSPYLGRVADVLDVLVVLAVVPVACAVLGLYGYVRGLAG
jgi:type VII secretion integral membrane protein EccD